MVVSLRMMKIMLKEYEQGVQQRIYKIKNVLRGYIRNNDFDHFWTITFDPKRLVRDNLVRYQAMEKWKW